MTSPELFSADDMMSGLIQSSVDPIIQIDEKGIIKLVNQACLSTFNYKEEDLIGKNVKMLMPDEHAAKHDEHLLRYKVTGKKKILGTGRKLQGLKSDGSLFPMFLTVSEAKIEGKTLFTGILRDLSAEEQEHDRMLAIVSSAVDPIVQINEEGIIQFVNSACCRTFQYKEAELVGHNVSILMPEPHSSLHDSYLKNYLTTGVKKVFGIGRKLRGRRSDGSTFSIYLTLSEANINGVKLFTGIMRNLSAEEQENEKMLSILQSAIDPIVQINEDGIIQFVNNACCKVFKYYQNDLLGQNVSMLMPEPHSHLHDSYLKNYITTGMKKVLGIGRKLRGRRSDGSTFNLYLTLSEAKIDGSVLFTGILRDLSAEEQEHKRMLSILTSSVDPIVQIDKNGIIKMVNDACCRAFQYKDTDLIGQNVKLLMPEPYAHLHDSFLSNYIETGVKKVIGVGRKLHGRRKDGSTFSLYLTVSEAKIGEEVYFTGILRDQSAEEQQHERMLSMIQSAIDPIVQIDQEGIIQFINPACCKAFQYQQSELIGQNVKMLMPEPHATKHDVYLNNYLSTGVKKVLGVGRKLHGCRKDGSTFSIYLTLSEAKINHVVLFTGIMRDLSAEEAEKERMLAILTSAVDPIVQIDEKGIIHFVNPACCKAFQYQQSELIGQNVKMLMPEPHATKHDSYLINYLTTGVRKVLGIGRKLRGRRRNGSTFSLNLTLSEAKINNMILFTGIMRDLSVEEAQYERMLAILSSAVDHIVQINGQGFIQFVNPACCKAFQYEKAELLNQNVNMLMPEPHSQLHDSYLKNYATSGIKKVLGIGRKLRGRRKNGTTFGLYLTLSEARLGSELFFTGILRDLSIEEAENNRMLSILKSAVDPIVQINERGIIHLVNDACCKAFRYKESELVGKNVKILMPEPHSLLHDSYLQNYCETGVKKVLGIGRQLRGRRSDGSTFSLYLTLSEAKIGNEIFFTGILRDQSVEEEEREALELLINSATDPIVVINSLGIIERVNPACSSAFGYSQKETLGRNVTMLMPQKHAINHGRYLERYFERNESKGRSKVVGKGRDLEGKRKDGSLFPIFLTVSECVLASKNRTVFIGIMRDMTEKQKAIAAEVEREKSEALLMNILPPKIAMRLKNIHDDSHIADYFEDVTILFADVVGFTEFSSSRSPVEVVSFLNKVFRGFDSLADKYGLEKIKTIGDAYMVVSGLQMEKDHTLIMLNFALEVIDQINEFNQDNPNEYTVSIRIGINSGSVVAGLVGSKKRFFDLWGDAVNVSARMESNGIENCIQCTEVTAKVAMQYPEKFAVVERGLIDVKGKGEMKVFLVGHVTSEGSLRERLGRHVRLGRRNSLILYQKMSAEFSTFQQKENVDPMKPARHALVFSMIGLIVGILLSFDFWGMRG
jgi:PAS domain S-box-containing protein